MSFKIYEGALARILETIYIYNFFVEHRPGIIHCDSDSIYRRPCLDQECAQCERFEKRHCENSSGLTTRNIGVMSAESVKQGKSQSNDDRPRFEQKLKGFEPSEDSLCETNMCSEAGPLQIHSLTKDTECSSKGRIIRQNTSHTPEGPQNESESSLLESETLQSKRVNENCNMSLDCDAIRVNETTRGKHLEPSNSVEAQLSCNILDRFLFIWTPF